MHAEHPTAQDLLAHLLRHETASAALRTWCAWRFAPAALSARVIAEAPSDAAILPRRDGEPLRHRRVELCWGDTVVSSADNWYLPDRLPQSARAQLLTGDVPFGVLLAAYAPHRTMIHAAPATGDHVLEISATLSLPDQGEVALVREFYHRALLGGRDAK